MNWSLVIFPVLSILAMASALWVVTKIADIEDASLGKAVIAAVTFVIIAFIILMLTESRAYRVFLNLILFIATIKIIYKAAFREIALLWLCTGMILSGYLILMRFCGL